MADLPRTSRSTLSGLVNKKAIRFASVRRTIHARKQLTDIERSIDDPEAFRGMERQRVTEALIAAKLSRNLERPRTETDGRFLRAIRLAEADGSYRQKLEAKYEQIWTAFWW